MSYSDWQRWCNQSQSSSLSSQLATLDGLSFTAISAYGAAALIAAFFGYRWLQLCNLSKALLWQGWRWYLAAMTLGCAFGCARAAVWWRAQTNSELSYANGYINQNLNSDPVQAAILHSEINRYWAPQQLLLSLEKMCNTFADIQILHYQVLLLLAADTVREKRLQFVKILNTMQIALALINVVHFALNCKSADLNIAAMNSFLRTAEAFRSGQYATGARLYSESLSQYNDPSDFYQGISLWFEALITLSVVAGFALVGVWALRKIYHTEHLLSVVEMRIADDNSHSKRVANLAIGKSKRIRLRIQLVLHLILFAYLFRAIFECMHAYAYTGVDRNVDQKDCGVCDSCQNMATVMSAWFERNPQVQIISNILAGPVALVLGLYGMKAGSILRLARTSSDQVSSEPPMGSTLPPMGSTLRQ